jgi:hypothetical protein
MSHSITHPFESTRCSRFYPAGALRDTESLLTAAGDEQAILSLSSSRPEQVIGENQRPGKAQQDTREDVVHLHTLLDTRMVCHPNASSYPD